MNAQGVPHRRLDPRWQRPHEAGSAASTRQRLRSVVPVCGCASSVGTLAGTTSSLRVTPRHCALNHRRRAWRPPLGASSAGRDAHAHRRGVRLSMAHRRHSTVRRQVTSATPAHAAPRPLALVWTVTESHELRCRLMSGAPASRFHSRGSCGAVLAQVPVHQGRRPRSRSG